MPQLKPKTKARVITETERNLIIMALRAKCELDEELAAGVMDDDLTLHHRFTRQSRMAEMLADLFESADLIDVWP